MVRNEPTRLNNALVHVGGASDDARRVDTTLSVECRNAEHGSVPRHVRVVVADVSEEIATGRKGGVEEEIMAANEASDRPCGKIDGAEVVHLHSG